MKKPEILAPAGSFEAAFYAFEGGADAVYCGLQSFSAHKSAANFSFEQLRRLKTIAVEKQKKIYVTINTIVNQNELPELVALLSELQLIGVDAIIVQDPGVAHIIKNHFPEIEQHASTQMAAHTVGGVELLKNYGFSRVVLSRELTLENITEIRNALPDIELEVFIHGALCYSFSGMCLASGIILGRSGNRGECAQLCRSFYEINGEKHYLFSCNDLVLHESVLKLAEAGVDSLKIEGRMKSPEYVFNVSSLYHAILNKAEAGQFKENSALCFERKGTSAFFLNPKGDDLINPSFPGHKGLPLGIVEKTTKNSFFISLQRGAGLRDGIMFFINNDMLSPVKFSIENMMNHKKIKIRHAKQGETVEIETAAIPQIGQEIFQLSSRTLDSKSVNDAQFSIYKSPLTLTVTLESGQITVSCKLFDQAFSATKQIEIQPAQQPRELSSILQKLFQQSDTSLFVCSTLDLINKTDLADNAVFIQPSLLKQVKKAFYEELDLFAQNRIEAKQSAVMNAISSVNSDGEKWASFENRHLLSPKSYIEEKECCLIPFAHLSHLKNIESLANFNKYTVVPLMPVLTNESLYFNALELLIKNNPDKKFLLGINNIAHAAFAKKLPGNVEYFLDFFSYCANSATWLFYRSLIGKKLLFSYYWIEGENNKYDELKLNVPLVKISDQFVPPLFTSRICFLRHVFNQNCSECNQRAIVTIKNMNRVFSAVVYDCTAYLFKPLNSSKYS